MLSGRCPDLPGWRRVGVEWHGPCPVTGAGHDCCWCGPGASTAIRIGCRHCGGRLDAAAVREHLAALGADSGDLAPIRRKPTREDRLSDRPKGKPRGRFGAWRGRGPGPAAGGLALRPQSGRYTGRAIPSRSGAASGRPANPCRSPSGGCRGECGKAAAPAPGWRGGRRPVSLRAPGRSGRSGPIRSGHGGRLAGVGRGGPAGRAADREATDRDRLAVRRRDAGVRGAARRRGGGAPLGRRADRCAGPGGA